MPLLSVAFSASREVDRGGIENAVVPLLVTLMGQVLPPEVMGDSIKPWLVVDMHARSLHSQQAHMPQGR